MDVKPSFRQLKTVVPVGLPARPNRGKRQVVSKAHPININALFTVPQGFGTVMGTKAAKPQVVPAQTVMTTLAMIVKPAACPNFEPLLTATAIPQIAACPACFRLGNTETCRLVAALKWPYKSRRIEPMRVRICVTIPGGKCEDIFSRISPRIKVTWWAMAEPITQM
jgi:hypothetical protein